MCAGAACCPTDEMVFRRVHVGDSGLMEVRRELPPLQGEVASQGDRTAERPLR